MARNTRVGTGVDKNLDVSSVSSISYSIDLYSNGASFSNHKVSSATDSREIFALKLQDVGLVLKSGSNNKPIGKNPIAELENNLMRLSRQGVLSRSTIYFGVASDPFHPFEGKFDTSMRLLNLFTRFQPGLLVVQTRSPLVVIAMPVFRQLRHRAVVTMGVETSDDRVAGRYTAHLPRPSERIKAANALRKCGVEVTLQVNPLLPYGEWQSGAGQFANWLNDHGDYVYIKPLYGGGDGATATSSTRRQPIATALANERRFHWLRADAAEPALRALANLCPEKLLQPKREWLSERQLTLNVA